MIEEWADDVDKANREAYPKFSTTIKNRFKTEGLCVNWSKELALIPRAKDGSLGRKHLILKTCKDLIILESLKMVPAVE